MENINRRKFMQLGLSAASAVPVFAAAASIGFSTKAHAENLPACGPANPQTTVFKYVSDATKSTVRTDKTHFCHNCMQYAVAKRAKKETIAKTGSEPCQIIPGCKVEAIGWCSIWAPVQA